MKQAERDNRLKELNQICMQCQADAATRFETINPKSCLTFCPTGREIHKLEDPKWDQQDWNSFQLEDLYHN